MKKLMIYLGIVVVLFAALIFINNLSNKASDDDNNPYRMKESDLTAETRKQLDDPNYQNIILPGELDQKLQTEEELFVYFFQPTCVHCQRTTPVLMPIAEKAEADLKQFNLWEFRSGWEQYNIHATPTIVYYKNGEEVDRMEGGIASDGVAGYSEQDFEQFFNKYKNAQ